MGSSSTSSSFLPSGVNENVMNGLNSIADFFGINSSNSQFRTPGKEALQTVSPFTPAQLQAQQAILGAADRLQPTANEMQDLYGQTIRGNFLDPLTNPNAVADYNIGANMMRDNFRDATAPMFGAQAMSAGANRGSAYDQSAQNLANQYGRTLGDYTAQYWNNVYNTERQIQNNAMSNYGQMAQSYIAPQMLAQQVGGLQQAQAQQEADVATNNARYMYGAPVESAQGFVNLTTPLAALMQRSKTKQSGPFGLF